MCQNKLKMNFKKINKAINKTSWPGRLEELNFSNKRIILDGSHNIDGAKKLKEFLQTKKIKPTVLFGMLNNKKIDFFLSLIKNQISNVLAIKIPNENNAFQINEIEQKCKKLSIDCYKIKNLNEALKYIKKSNQKIFLITGSLYLVGKIRKRFL